MRWNGGRYFANWKEKAFAVGLGWFALVMRSSRKEKGIGRHADGDLFCFIDRTDYLTATGARALFLFLCI